MQSGEQRHDGSRSHGIAEELEKVGDLRLERETDRYFEHVEEEEEEEEENEKTKTKSGEGMQPAAASGGAVGVEVQRSLGGVPMEQAGSSTKRKAEMGNDKQAEKKTKAQEVERGVKRSIDEWEDFAKKLKIKARQSGGEQKAGRWHGHRLRRRCQGDWSSIVRRA